MCSIFVLSLSLSLYSCIYTSRYFPVPKLLPPTWSGELSCKFSGFPLRNLHKIIIRLRKIVWFSPPTNSVDFIYLNWLLKYVIALQSPLCVSQVFGIWLVKPGYCNYFCMLHITLSHQCALRSSPQPKDFRCQYRVTTSHLTRYLFFLFRTLLPCKTSLRWWFDQQNLNFCRLCKWRHVRDVKGTYCVPCKIFRGLEGSSWVVDMGHIYYFRETLAIS